MPTTCILVLKYFKGDLAKAALWFNLPNPALGNISPEDMINSGQSDKLHDFIISSLEGDTP
jgi:hypothetical protein